jgi:hypothetical protein
MKFNHKKVAFGRHETFALRYSWLTKAYQELINDKDVFESVAATVKLGVGKNMVSSIRYWAQAAQIIKKSEDSGYQPTTMGKFIFDEETGKDPYLEDEATIWLLHWLIASNSQLATSIYWFFNSYHRPEFTSIDAHTALLEFTKQNLSNKYSKNTLKNDIAVILRMYADTIPKKNRAFDDILDAPFTVLKLMSMMPDNKTYQLQITKHDHLPIEILGYAIASIFKARSEHGISIADLMYSNGHYPAPGAIFCLTENTFSAYLDKLSGFKISDSAGINQLYQISHEEIDPMTYLHNYYEKTMNMRK